MAARKVFSRRNLRLFLEGSRSIHTTLTLRRYPVPWANLLSDSAHANSVSAIPGAWGKERGMRKEELPGRRGHVAAPTKDPVADLDVVHQIDVEFARFREMRDAIRKQSTLRRRVLMTEPSN